MRTTEEIYQEMLVAFRERSSCDLEDSCDLAVRLYAVAAQVQALECQTDWVLNQSFPQTAQGVYLDDHAAMRGIARQEAEKAVGMPQIPFSTVKPSLSSVLQYSAADCSSCRDSSAYSQMESAVPAIRSAFFSIAATAASFSFVMVFLLISRLPKTARTKVRAVSITVPYSGSP